MEYGWPPALMCTCASMQKQFPLISRIILKERSTSTSSDLSGGSSDCERQRLQQGPIEQNRLLALTRRSDTGTCDNKALHDGFHPAAR